MCLVRMKVEHEDEESIPSPPRRILVRPVSNHGSERIIIANHISNRPSTSSRPVSRTPSHARSNRYSTGRIISIVDPAPSPRPSQYILSPSLSAPTPTAQPHHTSIPRIIHAAPSPSSSVRASPGGSPRPSNSSPRVSFTSVHSTTAGGAARPTSSRHSSVGGNSPRGSRTRIISHDGTVVYLSTERDRGTVLTTGGGGGGASGLGGGEVRRSLSVRLTNGNSASTTAARTGGERPRSMTAGPAYLTTASAAMLGAKDVAVVGGGGGSGGTRDRYGYGYGYLEDRDRDRERGFDRDMDMTGLRARSRSITYATTGGPRMSRERVLVEEGGRRRESYQLIGGGR